MSYGKIDLFVSLDFNCQFLCAATTTTAAATRTNAEPTESLESKSHISNAYTTTTAAATAATTTSESSLPSYELLCSIHESASVKIPMS